MRRAAIDQCGHEHTAAAFRQAASELRLGRHAGDQPGEHLGRLIGVGDGHHVGDLLPRGDEQEPFAVYVAEGRPTNGKHLVAGRLRHQRRLGRGGQQLGRAECDARIANAQDVT